MSAAFIPPTVGVRIDSSGRICPEAERRDAMNDGEFWAWVFNLAPDTDEELDHDDRLVLVGDLTPCAECGELGACAYDDHGRALVHLIPEEDAT